MLLEIVRNIFIGKHYNMIGKNNHFQQKINFKKSKKINNFRDVIELVFKKDVFTTNEQL